VPKIWYTTVAEPLRRQHLQAEDLPSALQELQARGPAVTAASLQAPARAALPRPAFRLLSSVYEQLASLLEQGQELSAALRRLAKESVTPRLGLSLAALSGRVSEGSSLSEAMAEQPRLFDALVVHTIAAAEQSGDLPAGLRSLADHQRELDHLGADLALPLVYPFFLLCLMGGVGTAVPTFLALFILPKFVKLFTDLGLKQDQFPWITRFFMGYAEFLRVWGGPVFIAVVVAVILYVVRSRSRAGRLEMRVLGVPVPFFGRLAKETALARAAATLRLLLSYGVPVQTALRLAGQASGSLHVSLALRRAEYAVREGGSLAEGLRETGLLPDSFVFSLSGAEASGDLLATLEHLETDYRRDVALLTRSWVVVAGPVIVLFLGVMVGFMALSMYLPLISIIQQLSGS